MNNDAKKSWTDGMLAGMMSGSVSVPYLLIKYYRKLNLTDVEAMILIQMIAFKEKEMMDFPTHEDIQQRMTSSGEVVIKGLQKLVMGGIITIEEDFDRESGIQSERYNFTALYTRIAALLLEEQSKVKPLNLSPKQEDSSVSVKKKEDNVFLMFEREFARPLSPMECETISGWLDLDRYSLELITAALKESVFAGKLNFRYIDRILLEWSRNRVFTAEQAKEYSQKFRSGTR
ncbi:DNA replication protein DnaD [Paenibacillus swuensis]|uniref:DNA replication protein DnaD n=1 Tax=Paenibacillus swuensis TaxID=1178515 RepID=A0A172TLT0_9BACL|nr:DnaD domain protein [Paenibacillus swuensis]ANE47926.1 DNA replication protein DnaD [Paenibacillus swuensis]